MTRAHECLAGAQWDSALALAGQAHALRHDEDARRLLAVVHLLRRDFPTAWRCGASHVSANANGEQTASAI
jgi:hypothetical protein